MGNNLLKAVKDNDINNVKKCIKKGADVNVMDKDCSNFTPLHWASYDGYYDIAKYLISKGANINMKTNYNRTPLHYASIYGKDKVVELLLANGADVTIKDYDGNTARDIAIDKGHNNIVQLFDNSLKSQNNQIDEKTNNEIITSKQSTTSSSAVMGNKASKELLQAVKYNNINNVKNCIEKGANVNMKDNHSNNWSPLHTASFRGYYDIAKYLISKGADINMKDKNGYTSFHQACWNGKDKIVQLLIANDADLTIKNTSGDTPRDIAKKKGYNNIVQLIDNSLKSQNNQIDKKTNNQIITSKQSTTSSSSTAAENRRKAAEEAKRKRKAEEERIQREVERRLEAERRRKAQEEEELAMALKLSEEEKKRSDNHNNNNEEDDDDDDYRDYLPLQNNILNESYKASTYKTSDNKEIIANSNGINLQSNEEAYFGDGVKFIMVGYIGSGQQTYAYKISVNRYPKVLKLLQNDASMRDRVVTPAEFTINTCYPFNGESREDDYNNYLSKFGLVDDDDESLEEYFEQIISTFTSWEVKEYNGKQYSISELFGVIKESADEKRDCIRLCYFYYLLKKMKIAHCDVAPRNVLITYDGPVLIDFGASVKFKNINLNALPYDVTPKYYMDNRVAIRPNHDVKGFYYTATKYFPNIVPYDEAMIAQLDEMNRLKLEDIVLSHCH